MEMIEEFRKGATEFIKDARVVGGEIADAIERSQTIKKIQGETVEFVRDLGVVGEGIAEALNRPDTLRQKAATLSVDVISASLMTEDDLKAVSTMEYAEQVDEFSKVIDAENAIVLGLKLGTINPTVASEIRGVKSYEERCVRAAMVAEWNRAELAKP